jgi:hypothetical protein
MLAALPLLRWLLPERRIDGKELEGHGVAPDIEVDRDVRFAGVPIRNWTWRSRLHDSGYGVSGTCAFAERGSRDWTAGWLRPKRMFRS